jgi:hypothetical protein
MKCEGVDLVKTGVSEECLVHIFRVEKSESEGNP